MSHAQRRPPTLAEFGITIDDIVAQAQRDANAISTWRRAVEFAELVHKIETQRYERQRTKGTKPIMWGFACLGIIFWFFMCAGMNQKDLSLMWIGFGVFLLGLIVFSGLNEKKLAENQAGLPPKPLLQISELRVYSDPRVDEYCRRLIEYMQQT